MTSLKLARRSAAPAAGVLLAMLIPAASAAEPGFGAAAEEIAPGVTYESAQVQTPNGTATTHLLTVRLAEAKVDLLHPGAVAAADRTSDLANAQNALAGVNADFFNITSEHDGVAATKSSVGPAIAAGKDLKAAVPDGQRHGPGLADGTSTKDVFGVGTDGNARVGTLELAGTASSAKGDFDLEGLNQYAIAVDGIGAFNQDWGSMSRARSTCGTDNDRDAPCSDNVEEVVVTDGVVASGAEQPGSGEIPANSVVLLGREGGADELEQLEKGDKVAVDYELTPAGSPDFGFAVGGAPILRDGKVLGGVDGNTYAPRTSAGVSADGKTVYLAVVDGRGASVGMSLEGLADWQHDNGADDAVNLDGGGSSTLVARESGEDKVSVRNTPSGGEQRQVPNGIGVFPAG